MLKLIKVSSPGWEKNFHCTAALFFELEDVICNNCKINTFDEMKKSFEESELIGEFTDEAVQQELDSCCISGDYGSMSIEDKVHELLGTACGCEYMLEEGG